MKFENIVKRLEKLGYEVYEGEFDFQKCHMCNGTALIDVVDGDVNVTQAKLKDVISQIQDNKSHIQNVNGKKKILSEYNKFGY